MSSKFTEPEVEKLFDLAGELPLAMLSRRYNQWAKANGYQSRTQGSLRHYMGQRGLALEPVGEYIRTGTILQCLESDQGLIERWVRNGWIEPVQMYRDTSLRLKAPRRAFRRLDLRRMARKHPQAFAGCPREGLFMLLEDESLVDQIRKDHPNKPHDVIIPKPVVCLDTMKRYPSCAAAARAIGCSESAIRKAVRHGIRAYGLRWEALKPLNPKMS